MEISNLILWSDSTLVAVNKPAGLLTIADGYNPTLPYLSQMLQSLFEKVWVIHRLDKDTSGVLLFALNAEAHQHLNRQFQLRETSKEYHALVLGNPDWEHKTISLPLIVNGDRGHRTVVNLSAGKPATTEATVLKQFEGISYISAQPLTGYTHQIRAHFSTEGLPILCDPLYKSRKPETLSQQIARDRMPSLPIQRTALHAFQITFRHPTSGESLSIQAPEPPDFVDTLQLLNS